MSVLATFALMTDTNKKTTLERVPCIWYLVRFCQKNDKDKDKNVRSLIDSSSEVNAIHPTYATKLGLCARKIDVGAQKMDGSYLDIFKIVIVDCLVKNKLKRVQFFQEIFLLANISLEMILEILFFTLSKADIWFAERKLVWRTYTAAEALPMTKRVEIIDKREFAAAALNADNENFVVYIVVLVKSTTILIYSSCQAQVTTPTSEETGISAEYSDFSNVFSSNSAAELLEHTRINNHPINLLDDE